MSHQRADILLRLTDGSARAITGRQAQRLVDRGLAEPTAEGLRLRPDDYRVNGQPRRDHGTRDLPHGPYREPIDHNLLFYPAPGAFKRLKTWT